MTAQPEARSAQIRDRILQSDDLNRKPIDLAEWWPDLADEQLYVRSMTAGDRSRYEQTMDFDVGGNARDRLNIQTKLVVRVLVDAEGNRIFEDDDLDVVSTKHAGAIQAIFELGAELNGLTEKSLKALEKNSEQTTTDS